VARGTFGGWRGLTQVSYGPAVVEPEPNAGRARASLVWHPAGARGQ
jgi:hypothetical protein